MSGGFEKETAGSTAKSLVGALVALGSGFVFMFLGLVAVTASSTSDVSGPAAHTLKLSLERDFAGYQKGSLSVSPDQKVLKFSSRLSGQEPSEVTYKVMSETGEVSRTVGADSQRLAKLPQARFKSAAGVFRLLWTSPRGDSQWTWALNRWGGKP